MRLLIVEDDPLLADVVRRGVTRDGHTSDTCVRGDDVLLQAKLYTYDATVLDIMLPGIDGIEICRRLRVGESTIPIVSLTARNTVDDIVAGREAGADDYITKPFAFRELRARLHSVVRRAAGSPTSQLRAGDLVLGLATHQVERACQRVPLSAYQFCNLSTWAVHPRARDGRWKLGTRNVRVR